MKTVPYVLGIIILAILAAAVGLAYHNKHLATQTAAVVATTAAEDVGDMTASSTEIIATSTVDNSAIGNNSANSTSTPGAANMIRVMKPIAQQAITSGFQLQGEAKGNWYFEASFPVKILDADGNTVAQFSVAAIGDWMTTNFVPFKQTVAFEEAPKTNTGTLILMKDNPSGLPENDAQLVIPIKFATSSISVK